ncbi:hypothetical protein CANARDRAFT_193106 [[Candida] arabinofermentans NRRL YB-2248]|uniref:Amino acid permease/ SLC12A domain-containing protein n=1 Tax=[Candida] arabinofermentans NRRL YB-2248 TaxID=983967 RepID=A0A1E4T7L9_9ASCO|nr:hypothetical protein CANARDRAFT_193106 [[Candida] arabinofermentans NRRL YB-2248]
MQAHLQLGHTSSVSHETGGLFPKITLIDTIRSNIDDSSNNDYIDEQNYSDSNDPHQSVPTSGNSCLYDFRSNFNQGEEIRSDKLEMMDDDLRSSVINDMIKDKQIFQYIEEAPNSKFYFANLYNKYCGTVTTDQENTANMTDFDRYNNNLHKEEMIKEKIRRAIIKKQDAIRNQNNKRVSNESFECTLNTVPIDDYIDVDELPIEMQPYRQQPQNGEHRRHKLKQSTGGDFVVSDDSQVEMILSNEEHVDYNFERIKRSDPEDGFHRITEPSSSSPNSRSFKGFFTRILKVDFNSKTTIQRKLKVRHLNQIALGGTLGVGLLLSSGKAFSIAGPLGCLLGFIFSGAIVLATMLSFCEMVTLIPLCGGVSGVSSRFVDDAFGFALGVNYWFSYSIGLPTEITAASIMLSFYSKLDVPGPNTAGWISLFLLITLSINLCDIRVYGEFEYFSTVFKLMILVALMIYMVILNCGGSAPHYAKIGFKYWQHSKSNFAEQIIYGPFRETFDVLDTGLGSTRGIGGGKGRLCQIMVASIVAAYAYVGTEIVIIAGGESRNPRRSIPIATRNIYWRIIIFYVLTIFIIGLNIYSGDPRLLRYFTSGSNLSEAAKLAVETQESRIIELNGGSNCDSTLLEWAGFSNGNQSPFVIALQSAGLCSFASVVNGFLVYFALTAASSQLYAASRTLYYLSIQAKAPKIFSLCTKSGVPFVSVIFTGLFGCLAFLSVNNNTALVFERLLSVCATTGLLVWSGMCLSFIRFYHGLKLRPDIISRDDENYPYRSPFQPYLAYFGMVCSFTLVIVVGFVVFLRGNWSVAYFISNYGSLFVFVLCYGGYKVFRRTKIHRLDQLDLDSGRREIDRIIWEDEKNYSSNFREIFAKLVRFIF